MQGQSQASHHSHERYGDGGGGSERSGNSNPQNRLLLETLLALHNKKGGPGGSGGPTQGGGGQHGGMGSMGGGGCGVTSPGQSQTMGFRHGGHGPPMSSSWGLGWGSMSQGMGGMPHGGGPGMGLPGLSESLLSMHGPGGMGYAAGMGMGGPTSAAAALGGAFGPPGKRARTSDKGSYASSIAGDHGMGGGSMGRRPDHYVDDYGGAMHHHAALNMEWQNTMQWPVVDAYTASINAGVKIASETAPCYVSTNSLRRMRKRAQTVVKDNWLPRDISMRTKGMALPVKGGNAQSTRGRSTKASAAPPAAHHPAPPPAPPAPPPAADSAQIKTGTASNDSDGTKEVLEAATASQATATAESPKTVAAPAQTSGDAAASETAAETASAAETQEVETSCVAQGRWGLGGGWVAQPPAAPADDAPEAPDAIAADTITQDTLPTQQDTLPPLPDTAAAPRPAPITSTRPPQEKVAAAQETVSADATCADTAVAEPEAEALADIEPVEAEHTAVAGVESDRSMETEAS